MNLLQQIESEQVVKAAKKVPEFAPGDTVVVNVKIVEGDRERVQAFEGVCIGRKNAGINSAFTVRKISYGEGVERIFPLHSPRIDSIQVIRRGDVRRAKLYYLRGLTGKAARISEKSMFATGGGAATAAEAFASGEAVQEAQLSEAEAAAKVTKTEAKKAKKAAKEAAAAKARKK